MLCRRLLIPCLLLVALASCGDDDGSGPPDPNEPAAIRTLAYVVSECRENAEGSVARQKLVIRQAGGRLITVKEFPMLGPLPTGLCPTFGAVGLGNASIIALAFQRIGVSPDGSAIVFEVTDDHSILGVSELSPEDEGIFVVQSDGTGLRRLGPASHEASFRLVIDPSSPNGLSSTTDPLFSFSPNGDLVAFTDKGPGPSGEDAVQIVTIDLATGKRTQVTRLPPFEPTSPFELPVRAPRFIDQETIAFVTQNAETGVAGNTVRADGSADIVTQPPPVALPGAALSPEFSITGTAAGVLILSLPGTPRKLLPGFPPSILELFVEDGDNLLQVTNFGRPDTGINGGRLLSRDRRSVLFVASANPLGLNPFENCQFFMINTLGAGLRQVTTFDDGEPSVGGCSFFRPGCGILVIGREFSNDTVIFYSTCDPLGTNSNSGEVFTMAFDGSGFHQLTHTRGVITEPDGTVTVELPGPVVYPQPFR